MQVARTHGGRATVFEHRQSAARGGTDRDLLRMVRFGAFRAGRYYRLNAGSITLAPLRARRTEIRPLVGRLARKFEIVFGRSSTGGGFTQIGRPLKSPPSRDPVMGVATAGRRCVEGSRG